MYELQEEDRRNSTLDGQKVKLPKEPIEFKPRRSKFEAYRKAKKKSTIIEDNNDSNVRQKDDPNFKRVYLKLAYRNVAKHLRSNYDFVEIDKNHFWDNYWVFCPEQYTHSEKDDQSFFAKARRLKLN